MECRVLLCHDRGGGVMNLSLDIVGSCFSNGSGCSKWIIFGNCLLFIFLYLYCCLYCWHCLQSCIHQTSIVIVRVCWGWGSQQCSCVAGSKTLMPFNQWLTQPRRPTHRKLVWMCLKFLWMKSTSFLDLLVQPTMALHGTMACPASIDKPLQVFQAIVVSLSLRNWELYEVPNIQNILDEGPQMQLAI